MMSLLSVTVKKARYVGAQASQFNTYVTLKLQNVKSTTVTVKGATPCWEQDFLFETNDLNTGLLIEVWSKGMIWDRAMGYHWIPLQTVQYSNEEGIGQWLSLEAELVMRDGEVVGTKMPTGHSLLVDCRFELPFDPENIEASDLQRKLEMLNNIMDQEARAEQARRQLQYFGHSGYSEDSDYTSDLNYPVGQHANSSASQFRTAAHQMQTPQRSLETSRENSYERDDAPHLHHQLPQPPPPAHQHHLSPGTHRKTHQRYSPTAEDYGGYGSQNSRQYQDNSLDAEPLFYNSRPRNKPDYTSQDAWASCESSFYNQSVDSVDAGYSVDADYYRHVSRNSRSLRRPSLERQTTLYDDVSYYGDTNFYHNTSVTKVNYVTSSQHFNQNQSCDEYFDTMSYPFQEERYGQDEEDRQWDSGGGCYPAPASAAKTGKKLPVIPAQAANHKRRASSAAVDEGYPAYEDQYRTAVPTPSGRRLMPKIPAKRSASRQSSFNESEAFEGYCTPENTSHRGASLPPTPTKSAKLPSRPGGQGKPFNSLPPTPGRQLPRPNLNRANLRAKRNGLMKRTSSADYADNADGYDGYYARPGAISARDTYNEDYNYAYQSIDNLREQDADAEAANPSDNRTNANANYLRSRNGGYDNYYDYSAQDDDYNDYAGDAAVPSRRRKFLGKRENSPLLQQNTDSLESRDDELKDSFETAVSSMSSSLHQLKSTPFAEYQPAPETAAPPPERQAVAAQYPGDKGMAGSVTVAQVHNNTAARAANQARGLLRQQDSVDSGSYYLQQQQQQQQSSMVVSRDEEDEGDDYLDSYNGYRDHELTAQESVESYVEEETEDTVTNDITTVDYPGKANARDSPSSVIHVDAFAEEAEEEERADLRRGSSQITVVLDPYHPALQRAASTRRSSGAEREPPYPSRRASADAYYEEQFGAAPASRKPSLAEAPVPSSRHASLRRSPPPPTAAGIAEEAPDAAPRDGKPADFEEADEEADADHRPKVTAQQRWLWAYNKIIMQLNVSTRQTY